jgi:hypothetical protein
VAAAIEPPSHVAEREAGDAFELIWPTGEVDDQIIDGPLSEEPEPITVVLRPVAPPTEAAEPSSAAPVADDVVLAVRRAIAALESESAGAEEKTPSAPTEERRSALKRLISGLRRH